MAKKNKDKRSAFYRLKEFYVKIDSVLFSLDNAIKKYSLRCDLDTYMQCLEMVDIIQRKEAAFCLYSDIGKMLLTLKKNKNFSVYLDYFSKLSAKEIIQKYDLLNGHSFWQIIDCLSFYLLRAFEENGTTKQQLVDTLDYIYYGDKK